MTKDQVTNLVRGMSDIFTHMDYNSCGPDKEYVILYGTKERKIIPEEYDRENLINLMKTCDEELYHSVIEQKLRIWKDKHKEEKPKENIEKIAGIPVYPIPLLPNEEVKRREEAHAQLCAEKQLPNFAMEECYHCHKKVFQDYEVKKGIFSHGRRGDEFVTGCPHCNYTFCD